MHKKRILIFPFNLLSHYLRCIQLANQHSDHEVFFAYSEQYIPFIKNAGYGFFMASNFDSARVMEKAAEFNFDWLNFPDIEKVFLSQVNVIKQLGPSLVIGDTSPTLKAAAEYCGVKYVSLMNGYMTKYYDDVRVVSQTHYSYKYLSKLPPNIANKITIFAESLAFRSVHKPFRKLRSKYKLSRVTTYLDELEGDENLICDDSVIFPQKKLPSNYRFIGPLRFYNTNPETELIKLIDNGKPTICVSMGSSGNWKELAFLNDSRFSHVNIIAAGDSNKVLKAPHIVSADFVNLDVILPLCSFLICHGGNGTIYEGLRHHKYMYCLTNNFEQEWNVHRLRKLNLGEFINNNAEEIISEKVKLFLRTNSNREKT